MLILVQNVQCLKSIGQIRSNWPNVRFLWNIGRREPSPVSWIMALTEEALHKSVAQTELVLHSHRRICSKSYIRWYEGILSSHGQILRILPALLVWGIPAYVQMSRFFAPWIWQEAISTGLYSRWSSVMTSFWDFLHFFFHVFLFWPRWFIAPMSVKMAPMSCSANGPGPRGAGVVSSAWPASYTRERQSTWSKSAVASISRWCSHSILGEKKRL